MQSSSGIGRVPYRASEMGLLTETELRERVERLAAIERGSASDGEREAAELIAEELGGRLETERVHGTYWWPVGILTALAGLTRRRLVGLLRGDRRRRRHQRREAVVPAHVPAQARHHQRRRGVRRGRGHGGRGGPPRRRALRARVPPGAAAGGAAAVPEAGRERGDHARDDVGRGRRARCSIALGFKRLGAFLCAGYAAAMADIGLRKVVPGANDNLTGVAVLLVARARAADPRRARDPRLHRLRGVLHGGDAGVRPAAFPGAAARADHLVICVDTVGSPHLLALEGEGMVWMNEYPKDLIARAHDAARRARHRAARQPAPSQRHRRPDRAARRLPDDHLRLGRRVQDPHQLPLADRHGRPRGLRHGGGHGAADAGADRQSQPARLK